MGRSVEQGRCTLHFDVSALLFFARVDATSTIMVRIRTAPCAVCRRREPCGHYRRTEGAEDGDPIDERRDRGARTSQGTGLRSEQ